MLRLQRGEHYEGVIAEFQWAPTLGGECYEAEGVEEETADEEFQWAPTLGGECYPATQARTVSRTQQFQWAPTLGGECYNPRHSTSNARDSGSFNGHPPLGVNATEEKEAVKAARKFGFNGHPPLGVNATEIWVGEECAAFQVSMGTHPWG